MASTFKIISHTVGEKGVTRGVEVLRVQQLLKLNKFEVPCNGFWGPKTRDALQAFQERLRAKEGFMAVEHGFATPVRPYLLPDDATLFELAYGAGVLIRLAPGLRGEMAFQDVHDWYVSHQAGFNWDQAVWGLHNYIMWAVVTGFDENRSHSFNRYDPLGLNCTLYANLMMAVWQRGNIHGPPFRAGVAQSGGAHHFAVERYRYPNLTRCQNERALRAAARHADQLYCLEAGDWVGHMALLLRGTVYECNVFNVRGSYVTSMPLADWCDKHADATWVSGPAPAH